MNNYHYGKLRLSLKVVSLQILQKSSVTIVFVINYFNICIFTGVIRKHIWLFVSTAEAWYNNNNKLGQNTY